MQNRNTSDLGENIQIQSIITGLAEDLANLRSGQISIQQARTSAELARQLFAGVRVMISARKMLEDQALPAPKANDDKK